MDYEEQESESIEQEIELEVEPIEDDHSVQSEQDDDDVVHEEQEDEEVFDLQNDEQNQQYDQQLIVTEQMRITPDNMSRLELARVLGYRARMIESTGDHFADLQIIPTQLKGSLNAMQIAILELQQKKCPLLIKRILVDPCQYVEIVNPNELILPKLNLQFGSLI